MGLHYTVSESSYMLYIVSVPKGRIQMFPREDVCVGVKTCIVQVCDPLMDCILSSKQNPVWAPNQWVSQVSCSYRSSLPSHFQTIIKKREKKGKKERKKYESIHQWDRPRNVGGGRVAKGGEGT